MQGNAILKTQSNQWGKKLYFACNAYNKIEIDVQS